MDPNQQEPLNQANSGGTEAFRLAQKRFVEVKGERIAPISRRNYIGNIRRILIWLFVNFRIGLTVAFTKSVKDEVGDDNDPESKAMKTAMKKLVPDKLRTLDSVFEFPFSNSFNAC